jgi:hypothetical protein
VRLSTRSVCQRKFALKLLSYFSLSYITLLCFFLSSELFDYGYYFELQGLGKLAEKFPNIASTSIYCLRDFLVTPSRILLTLRQQCGNADKDLQKLKITGILSCSCRDENKFKNRLLRYNLLKPQLNSIMPTACSVICFL